MLQVVRKPEQGGDRVTAIRLDLAKKLACGLNWKGGEDILLSDEDIARNLEQEAMKLLQKEEAAKKAAEEARKKEFLLAAKQKLGLLSPVVSAIASKEEPSAWQEYLADKEDDFLPSAFRDPLFNSELAISAARGFLIGVLQSHRQNPD